MPPTHSKFIGKTDCITVAKIPLLPLKCSPKVRGPAPPFNGKPDEQDIIDEAIQYFRANVLFRNFEIKGGADLLLIYLTVYITKCLQVVRGKSNLEAEKLLNALALENFPLPGESAFPLGGMVGSCESRAAADNLKQYLTQARQELGVRLVQKVYPGGQMDCNKWWISFSKMQFLGLKM